LVLLGGGLGLAAHRALARAPALAPWYQCPVEAAQLGDDAGVIGAGLHALAAQAAVAQSEVAQASPVSSPNARLGRIRRAVPSRRAVLVNGIPASGKSTVSRGIAERMGWP
ncbi:MAG: transcriptional regulator, partial [Mesorhizobium sp.]